MVLGVAEAALFTVGLFSCSNEETNNPQQENAEQSLSSKNTVTNSIPPREDGIPIGIITEDGTVNFAYNPTDVINGILAQANPIFIEIESIEIDDTYLTIIGKDEVDFSLLAFQAELINDGEFLYYPDPDIAPITVFSTDTCAGVNCTSCSVIKLDKKVNGCNCGGKGDPDQPGGYCNHSTTEVSGGEKAKQISEIIANIIKVLSPLF